MDNRLGYPPTSGTPQNDTMGAYSDGIALGSELPSNNGHAPQTAGGVGAGGGPASTTTASTGTGGDSRDIDYLRDIAALRVLCERATPNDPGTWEAVRSWLNSHSADEARRGAENVGEFNTTPLHLACRNRPPADVVDVLLSASPDSVRWEDSFGWLSLHYACANGASEDVLRMLADAFPDGKTATDRRGRTPLHFALGNTDRLATPETVVLLSSTGAGECADENGMLPLHYACAYGASEEALKILTDGHVDSITACDRKGRTPLHFALGNADRPFSPAVVRLLLSQYQSAVDAVDNEGSLPLHLLANRANTLKETQEKERSNAEACLILYIAAEPRPTADFLTALQALPGWLGDAAVVHPVVQRLLNDKISQKIPTAMVLFDFYFLLAVTIVYYLLAVESIEKRFVGNIPPNEMSLDQRKIDNKLIILLYFGAGWFMVRELLQIYSLVTLGLFKTWLSDSGNFVDVSFFVLSIVGGALMQTGAGNSYSFRTLAAFTIFLMWVKFLSFLRSIFINIAVFLKSFIYVLKKLASFMIAVIMILIMSAQAFHTLFLTDEYCSCTNNTTDNPNRTNCADVTGAPGEEDFRPFCGRIGHSFIKVYTMLLGEVDDGLFKHPFQVFLYACFMFFAVVLLAQVLIAIVTDSYGVISEKATIVFWSNRLDFVAEMDAIVALGCKSNGKDDPASMDKSSQLWKKLMDLFEDDISELPTLSAEFWCYILIRFVVCFIVPAWLLAGVLTAGLAWPPQIRAMIFVFSRRDPSERNETEQRTDEINEFKALLKEHQDELNSELSTNKRDLISMKNQLVDIRSDVTTQMSEIREIMTELYDLQLTLDS